MSTQIAARLRTIMDGPLGAVLGGALYGGWATFANRSLGWEGACRIGFVHWCMSVAITLGATWLMRRLFALASTAESGFWFALCGELVASYALLVGVHLWIGTPHILLTLAPGLVPNVAFSVVYATLLRKTAAPGMPGGAVLAR